MKMHENMYAIDGDRVHRLLKAKHVKMQCASVALGKSESYIKNALARNLISKEFCDKMCLAYGIKRNDIVVDSAAPARNEPTPIEAASEPAPEMRADWMTRMRDLERENSELKDMCAEYQKIHNQDMELLKKAKNVVAAFNTIMDIMKEVANQDA